MLTLSTKEVGELIKLGQNHRDGPLWSFLGGSGLRLGEALGLRWSDYDSKIGQLQVRRQLRRPDGQYVLTELKTKASRRTLRLTDTAREALERQREQQAAERTAAVNDWEDDETSRLLIFRAPTGKPMNSHKKRPGRTAGQAEFTARWRLAAEVSARSSDAAHAADYPDPEDKVTVSDIRWQEPR